MSVEFSKYIESEKAAVAKEMEALDRKQAELDAEREKLRLRLEAVQAYFSTLEGKPPAPRRTRQRRSGVRDMLMKTIRPNPQGLTRAEILEKMGVKGDKSAEQSVSNALATAKKKGEIVQADDGKYREAR